MDTTTRIAIEEELTRSPFAIIETDLTGALVPRDEDKAERMARRLLGAELERHVELMTGLTRRIPGGFAITFAIGASK